MGLLERLRTGAIGVEVLFPETIEPTRQGDTSFQFVGPQPAVGWEVLLFPGVALDLSDGGWSTLQRDVERQTRALFEQMFLEKEVTPERRETGPRTNDSAWSPVIELERSAIEGGSTLFVLHRVAYEPGWEVL